MAAVPPHSPTSAIHTAGAVALSARELREQRARQREREDGAADAAPRRSASLRAPARARVIPRGVAPIASRTPNSRRPLRHRVADDAEHAGRRQQQRHQREAAQHPALDQARPRIAERAARRARTPGLGRTRAGGGLRRRGDRLQRTPCASADTRASTTTPACVAFVGHEHRPAEPGRPARARHSRWRRGRCRSRRRTVDVCPRRCTRMPIGSPDGANARAALSVITGPARDRAARSRRTSVRAGAGVPAFRGRSRRRARGSSRWPGRLSHAHRTAVGAAASAHHAGRDRGTAATPGIAATRVAMASRSAAGTRIATT